ncbi:MAG TPA: haloacid dehalogenase [Anaerolineae bacterium]|nr:haloacid dehalogenase [Anaerolineae bacterium]
MRWPHYEHIFFDCDSTLSTIEGIDILAEFAGKKDAVEALTKAAMEGELGLEDVYAKRLAAITPTHEQIRHIRSAYKHHIVEDSAEIVTLLQELGHKVYIISGGLYEPVAEFGVSLGVPRERIRAVKLEYDQLSGHWWDTQNGAADNANYLDFDASPLTISDGKALIVRQLLGEQTGRSLLIGDGSSDLLASRAVDLFVGFGGVETRQPVLDAAPVFIHSTSLAPLIALAAGPVALLKLLDTQHQRLAQKACHLIDEGALTFNNERLSEKFQRAYQVIHSRSG